MEPQSKAAVHAIEAAVLGEYSENKYDMENAIECVKLACDLNSTNPYWFYLRSKMSTDYRRLLHTYRSSPMDSEKNALQEAIVLSNTQHVDVMYQEILLMNDTILNNFHLNKNKRLDNKHKCDSKKLFLLMK